MTITCTNGNSRNGIRGSRITVRAKDGKIIDRFLVSSAWGIKYCLDHPGGTYGKRFMKARTDCHEYDKAIND